MTMQFFTWSHLPEELQKVSKPIGELANLMNSTLPNCAEKSAGLRKLLEAKDCFVRAALPDGAPSNKVKREAEIWADVGECCGPHDVGI